MATASVINIFQQGILRLDKSFALSQEQFMKLHKPDTDLQLWVYSVRADDEVPNRFLWPSGTSLHINNLVVRPTNRSSNPSTNKTRDAPLSVGANEGLMWYYQPPLLFSTAHMVTTGPNSLTITSTERGFFAIGVQLVRKRAPEDVRKLMLSKETLAEAVQRVCSIIKGPDADDELVALSTTVGLRCPLTGCRMNKPVRFVNIRGLQVLRHLMSCTFTSLSIIIGL